MTAWILVIGILFLIARLIYCQYPCKKGTLEEIKSSCCMRSQGQQEGLPIILLSEDYSYVTKVMERIGEDAIWLPLSKKVFKEFTWVDGIKEPNFAWPEGANCGKWNDNRKKIEASSCQVISGKGSMCQINGCKSCKDFEKEGTARCYFVDPREECWVRDCTRRRWNEASWFCQKLGGHLVTLTHPSDKEIMGNLSEQWKNQGCKESWIGLRREYWEFFRQDGGTMGMQDSYWSKRTEHDKFNCAVMVKVTDGYFWNATACSSRFWGLCFSVHQNGTLTLDDRITQQCSEAPPAQSRVGLAQIVIMPLGFVVIVVLLALLLYKTKRK